MKIPENLTIADLDLQLKIQILTLANARDGMTISDSRLKFQGVLGTLNLRQGCWVVSNSTGSHTISENDMSGHLIHVEGLHRMMPN